MHTNHCPRRQSACACCLRLSAPTQHQQLETLQSIEGKTCPFETVRITIDDQPAIEVTADACGVFYLTNPYTLAAGAHKVCAQNCSRCKCCSCHMFCIAGCGEFQVEPIQARMGAHFRTIDVDVLISGASGPATVYYLLLPPGSPAPTAEEIMAYNTEALLDGTAATGRFDTTLTLGQSVYTFALTGLDNPDAPSGATGVIDGYRYDVYLYILLCDGNSGVLSFEQTAMGMPYASGLGTSDQPFAIRELTPEELALYPDLIAGNALNEPGVDETGRMLENIERLITLYEKTDGLYGLADSMALHYLMTSDIDLAVYAAAYGGAGWEAIGDIDGWINDRKETEHLFSGVFSGGGHTISNLSITPTATNDYFVGYRGLFGGVEYGTIRDLTLLGVTINALATAPGQAQFGSFISIARNPVLENLALQNANLVADIGEILIGDTHAVNVGGFVAELFDGGTVRNITSQNITITVPAKSALALGGFVGFTDKFDAHESYEHIVISNLSISGYALIGGLAGYMVYGVNLIENTQIKQMTAFAPGGESGGLIGRLYTYSGTGDCLIQNNVVEGIAIRIGDAAEGPGGEIGGLIGTIKENSFASRSQAAAKVFRANEAPVRSTAAVWPMTTITQCKARNGAIYSSFDGGGLIGHASINTLEAAARTLVHACSANISVSALNTNAGGLIGFMADTQVTDSYALGNCTGGTTASGAIGDMNDATIERCYSAGNVSASTFAGGIAGSTVSSSIQRNLVLGGTISAATAHRILGVNNGGSTLLSNYALQSVSPVPGTPDPNGLDGGTIVSAQIAATMQLLGWDTVTIWNTATIASLERPTLLQNPE